MTLVEEKTKEALEALGIGIKREVTLKELEFSFMGLERRYSPEYTLDEKYKDGIYFNKLKAHFEYVASDICRTNEAIRNILDPDNKTYEYQEKPIDILNDSVSYPNNYNYDELNELQNETLKNIKNNVFDFEDLAGLIYIKSLISPDKGYEKIKHVVIDEAQDFGEFNFFVLKNVLPFATFSIFGDLAQSIYDYRSINNWEEVNNTMFSNMGKIIKFNKSYRTTAEIMNVADNIAECIGLERSDLVVRHGNDVKLTKIEQEHQIPEYIAQKIYEYKEKGYNTIAVISKTNLLSSYINNDLANLGVVIPNISVNDDLNDEKFRICTISNQLSKGLEFDAVIINNAREKFYSSSNPLDMKLLYVAVTRALHELDIVYSGNISNPLSFN